LSKYLCGQMLLNSAFEKKMKIQEDGDADGAAPGFIASAAHTGSKAGYVFKMGPLKGPLDVVKYLCQEPTRTTGRHYCIRLLIRDASML
jgi:hypothetical protein